MALADTLLVFRSRKILLLLLLGFSSGLPLALTAGTLQAWLTVEGVDLKTIGWFALVGQPYTYKFLWAPLMDRFSLPFLGRRRGWLLVTQLALAAAIAFMGTLSPKDSPWLLAGLAVLVAFLSASQDVVFDALRADTLSAEERGAGAAVRHARSPRRSKSPWASTSRETAHGRSSRWSCCTSSATRSPGACRRPS